MDDFDEIFLFEELYTSKNIDAFKRYLGIKGIKPETITKISAYLNSHSSKDSNSTLKDFVKGLRNPYETLLWTNDVEERRVFNEILYSVIDKENNQDSAEDLDELNSEEQESDGEPIIISYEKLCNIEQNLQAQVRALWEKLGHSDLEIISTLENSFYNQIMDLDDNERACHLVYEAKLDVMLLFREKLNHSSGIMDLFILPLQNTAGRDAGKKYLLKPDDIISFIQMQHEYINLIQFVNNNAEALMDSFNETLATDYQKFEQDMVFLTAQKKAFLESILEQIGVVITEQDELGRISNIRYNE